MNAKHTALTLIAIVVCASVLGILYYIGVFLASDSQSPSTRPQKELRVFIASSLVDVAQNASQSFEKANNCKIIFNAGGSNSLYQQIISGSPCDVFISADFRWENQLNASKLLYNSNYQNFTSNTLAVILPKDNPKNISSLLDLIKPGIKIVIADQSAPVGSYTDTTLTKIDQTWGNSTNLQYKGSEWKNYRANFLANVVSYEINVEGVVGKVSLGLGTADAGVAFVSDTINQTMQGAKLQYIPIPSSINTRGTYGIAVINGTNTADLATKYMNFWLSSDAQNLLQTYGFGT